MTITRVQAVTAVLSGTVDTVTLPAAPQYGNTLIAVLARAGSAPVATSLTQPGVTWVSGPSGDNAGNVGHHIFSAQLVGPAAGDTVTVTRGDSDDYVAAVFEYAGLRNAGGALLDVTATASEDGNAPYTTQTATPTNQAIELFIAAVAHIDTSTRQETPSNGFVEVVQVAEAAADPAAVMLGCYEKVVDAIDQPNMAVHTDDWVVWNTRLQTFFGSLSATTSVAIPIDMYLVEAFDFAVSLDAAVADAKTLTATADLFVSLSVSAALDVSILLPEKQASLDVFVTDDGYRFVGLDVLVGPSLIVTLNVIIFPARFAALEVVLDVGPHRARNVDLDVLVVNRIERNTSLDCYVVTTLSPPSDHPVRVTAGLDVAVLVEAVPTDITTTPEDFRYLACRPLWCNVPRMKTLTAGLDVAVIV